MSDFFHFERMPVDVFWAFLVLVMVPLTYLHVRTIVAASKPAPVPPPDPATEVTGIPFPD